MALLLVAVLNVIIEEDNTPAEIVHRLTSNVTECYQQLYPRYAACCANMDEDKRMDLTLHIMYCDMERDHRAAKVFGRRGVSDLADRRSIIRKISDFDGATFQVYTTIFTNLDNICFQLAAEDQERAKLIGLARIYNATMVASEFLTSSRAQLAELQQTIVGNLTDVSEQVEIENRQLEAIHARVRNLTADFRAITFFAGRYSESLRRMKWYAVFCGIGLVLGLMISNVFIPTLAITGLFLLCEVHFSQTLTSRSELNIAYRWAYGVAMTLFFLYKLSAVAAVAFSFGKRRRGSRRRPQLSRRR